MKDVEEKIEKNFNVLKILLINLNVDIKLKVKFVKRGRFRKFS